MNDAEIIIDLGALAANYRFQLNLVAPGALGAVVKADAYGLGCERVVPVLLAQGCRIFFVATAHEAAQIAPLLPPDATNFVLNGFAPAAAVDMAATGAIPVINTLDQLAAWRSHANTRAERLPFALQLDTGMSRLGLPPADVLAIAADANLWQQLDFRLVMTHLACADEADGEANDRQLRAFHDLAALLPHTLRSVANSAGILLGGAFHGDLVRAGIALYGGQSRDRAGTGTRGVVTLKARVIQVREIAAGTAVGYGGRFVAPEPCRIATVGVGYADGVPRSLGGRGTAWVAGRCVPIVGRVSMDSLALDVSALPAGVVDEDSWATLLGAEQGIDVVGAAAGTIGYEILTRLGHRAKRSYRDAASSASLKVQAA